MINNHVLFCFFKFKNGNFQIVFFLNCLFFRFHVCAQSLPFGQSVAKNPAYFLLMIWDMVEYTNYLIRLSNNGNHFPSCSQNEGLKQYQIPSGIQLALIHPFRTEFWQYISDQLCAV